MAGRVLLTGSAGYLGSRAVEILAARGWEVFGIDVRMPKDASAYAGFVQGSVADREKMREAFARARPDAAVNLAFVVDVTHDEAKEEAVAVGGGNIFLDLCDAHRVAKVVFVTSVAAYGAHDDNDVPLLESSPTRGVKGYSYSRLKDAADRLVQSFVRSHPDTKTVILRPCLFAGPNTRNHFFDIMFWPIVPQVWDLKGVRDPAFQFIHEDEMAACLAAAVEKDVNGVFNIAGEGTATFSELVKRAGKRRLPLPVFLLYPCTWLLWKLHIVHSPPAQLDFIRYPWVMDVSRMRAELFTPRITSVEAFDAFVAARR
jgi:UDP-glucose 4-epimerase